ncbi:transporter substrate-binding domain-containing protein [Catenovulum sp. SM1970]|uniref:substrate-binding periplasmic protein n=1 Tax=Marinifaba aquimaris TaxID=2741323 RepID=UPI001571F782|nr:transporter substrate-binding domain-containing protein [Marinifaba aquimaris]NTS77921.1 transporter substrate-binding domain-containing protein [Marinifaba aquimaris]
MLKLSVSILLLFLALLSYSPKTLALNKETKILRLEMPDFPPYSYSEGGQLKGIAFEKVSAILNHAKIKHEIQFTANYGRAVHNVKNGLSDGFFLASQNSERDKIAVFSSPVMINKWSWFNRKVYSYDFASESFKQRGNVGSYLNANTHKWLIKQGYRNIIGASTIESLTELLIHDRIDSVLVAEYVFKQSAKKLNVPMSAFKETVSQEKPFGIYLAKKKIADQNDLMIRINKAIRDLAAK